MPKRRSLARRPVVIGLTTLLAAAATAGSVVTATASATGPTESLSALQAAIDSASSGSTVALTGDVSGATGDGLSIPSGENLTLDLAGYALSVNATGGSTAGVLVPNTSGLTIEDTSSGQTGTLTAQGDVNAAGIGGGVRTAGGNVTITGGTITATGGGNGSEGGAGIGGGYSAASGTITISGGSVQAIGGDESSGIGSCSSTASIIISGGSVTATGGETGAGIGGCNTSMPSAITISGGSIDATGGPYAAGIGSGYDAYTPGTITITGGTITATGGEESPGIGEGVDGDGAGSISIAGGSVTAIGGVGGGPGIGDDNDGYDTSNFAVTISGGITNATGGADAPGIGEGDSTAGTVPLSVDGAPLGTVGTDGGSSTGGGTASTITNDPSASIDYTATDVSGVDGQVTIDFWYPVSFDLNGHGAAISSQLIEYDADVTQPTAPTASGYTFGGWYSDSGLTTPFSFATAITPTGPVTLYANWSAIPVVPTTTTTPTTATTTTTPTQPAKVVNPTITAHVSSASKRSHGWYRAPVKITFTCKAGSAALKGGCPSPVTLSRNGARQKLTRTIRAIDGGTATVKVSGINIDQTKPKLAITGITGGATYLGIASGPTAHCRASDSLSGVASCSISVRRDGRTLTYTAKATDKAGNRTTKSTAIELSPFGLGGVTPSHRIYDVDRGNTYTLYVLAKTQPRYVNAAPVPLQPSGQTALFTRVGMVGGLPEWKVQVTIDVADSTARQWNLGYLVGTTLHIATVTVSH